MTQTAPSSEEEFLLAIARAPEDDELRLRFAAFLRPYEADLAAFIELQVSRVQGQRRAGVLDTEDLPPEERRLLSAHAPAWSRGVARFARPTGAGGPRVTFYRGLVAQIGIDADVFVERGTLLMTTTAIRHVDFAPLAPGALERLLASEALAQLDSIGFAGAGLDDAAVAAIASGPHLARCLYLDLRGNALGSRAFEAIAASPHLRQLLVVDRAQRPDQDPALSAFPGEVRVTRVDAAGMTVSLQPVTAQGCALEAAHGPLPWLRWRNRTSRFDARWYVERGLRPVAASRAERTA
jgi:uncharacterized protein (TIGR02996 family)